MQKAIAFFAAGMINLKPRQIWLLEAGSGKSRMIASLALCLLLKTSCKHIHILIPNSLLLKRDQIEYSDYFMLCDQQDSVSYHETLDFEIKQDSVVLVDEADHFILSDPKLFARIISKIKTICFTATVCDNKSDLIERQIFVDLELNLLEYKTWGNALPKSKTVDEEV